MTGWKERKKRKTESGRRKDPGHEDVFRQNSRRARILYKVPVRREGGGTGAGTRQVPEGARGMPWLPEAKKDAAGCEKPRGGANGL